MFDRACEQGLAYVDGDEHRWREGYAFALQRQCHIAHMLLRVKGAGDGSHG